MILSIYLVSLCLNFVIEWRSASTTGPLGLLVICHKLVNVRYHLEITRHFYVEFCTEY